MEKRRIPRLEMELPVAVKILDGGGVVQEILEGFIQNVSAGGTYLQSDKAIEIGTSLAIELVLPSPVKVETRDNKTRIEVSGIVVRADASGIGISFDENYTLEPFPG